MRSKPVRLRDGHAAFRSSNDKYGRMTLRTAGRKEHTVQLPRQFDLLYPIGNPASSANVFTRSSSRRMRCSSAFRGQPLT